MDRNFYYLVVWKMHHFSYDILCRPVYFFCILRKKACFWVQFTIILPILPGKKYACGITCRGKYILKYKRNVMKVLWKKNIRMRIFNSSYNCLQASVNRLQHVEEVFIKIMIDVVNERTSNTEKQMLFVSVDGECNSGLIHAHFFSS